MIWWVVFFFLTGMFLILAEFIVPGGICGLVGGLLVLASGGIGVYTFPEYALEIVTGELVGAALCITFGIIFLSRSRTAKKLFLDATQQAEAGFVSAVSDTALIGRTGTALTVLRPAGAIQIDGRRVDAVSTGVYIEKESMVRVTEVHGNRVVVEPASETAPQ